MNIIPSNCVGARVYEALGVQYNNPFMWLRIEHKQYMYLLRYFDTIDFMHPVFSTEYYKSDKYMNVKCQVDDQLIIHYTHYVWNEEYDSPTKIKVDILYKDILNYAKEKYFSRLERMKKSTETPRFLYSFNGFKGSDAEYLRRIGDALEVDGIDLTILAYKGKELPIELKNHRNSKYITYIDDNILNSTTEAIAKNIKYIFDEQNN